MTLKKVQVLALVSIYAFLIEGCSIWPLMVEEHGYRPVEMGKRDQVWYWNAHRPIVLSQDFGDAFHMAKESQIVNLESLYGLDPVVNIDGKASANTMKRYQRLFEKPAFKAITTGAGKK